MWLHRGKSCQARIEPKTEFRKGIFITQGDTQFHQMTTLLHPRLAFVTTPPPKCTKTQRYFARPVAMRSFFSHCVLISSATERLEGQFSRGAVIQSGTDAPEVHSDTEPRRRAFQHSPLVQVWVLQKVKCLSCGFACQIRMQETFFVGRSRLSASSAQKQLQRARTHTHTHTRTRGGGGFCPTFRTKETLKNEVSTVVPSNGGRTYQILFCSVQRHELFFFLKFPCCTEVDQLVEDSVKPHKKYIWRVYFQKQTLMDNTLSARQNHVIIVANYLPSS